MINRSLNPTTPLRKNSQQDKLWVTMLPFRRRGTDSMKCNPLPPPHWLPACHGNIPELPLWLQSWEGLLLSHAIRDYQNLKKSLKIHCPSLLIPQVRRLKSREVIFQAYGCTASCWPGWGYSSVFRHWGLSLSYRIVLSQLLPSLQRRAVVLITPFKDMKSEVRRSKF